MAKRIYKGWLKWHTFIRGYMRNSLAVLLQHKEKASARGAVRGRCYLDAQVLSFYYYCSKNIIINVVNYTVPQIHSQKYTRKMPYY